MTMTVAVADDDVFGRALCLFNHAEFTVHVVLLNPSACWFSWQVVLSHRTRRNTLIYNTIKPSIHYDVPRRIFPGKFWNFTWQWHPPPNWDLTVQGPPSPIPTSDIWWSSLEASSNLFTSGPPSHWWWHLVAGCWSTYGHRKRVIRILLECCLVI